MSRSSYVLDPAPDLASNVYEELRNTIVTGLLRPGERLREVPLAQRFGVSRTPVHDALIRLEVEGLAEKAPGRGMVVTNMTARRLHELFQARLLLEPPTVGMAARAITKAELDQVAEIHEALRNLAVGWDDPAFDWARFGALSRQFHLAVLRA